MFNRITLALLGAMFVSSAFAADANLKPYTQRYETPVNWSMSYVGLQGGYANDSESNLASILTLDTKGWFLGGMIGTQYQFGNWVYGVELTANYSNQSGVFGAGPVAVTHDLNAFGTLNGRLGYAMDRWLVYGTGGLTVAYGELGVRAPGLALSDSSFHYGWNAGAGVEYMMSRDWTVRAEYLWHDLGSQNYTLGPVTVPVDVAFSTMKVGVAKRF